MIVRFPAGFVLNSIMIDKQHMSIVPKRESKRENVHYRTYLSHQTLIDAVEQAFLSEKTVVVHRRSYIRNYTAQYQPQFFYFPSCSNYQFLST